MNNLNKYIVVFTFLMCGVAAALSFSFENKAKLISSSNGRFCLKIFPVTFDANGAPVHRPCVICRVSDEGDLVVVKQMDDAAPSVFRNYVSSSGDFFIAMNVILPGLEIKDEADEVAFRVFFTDGREVVVRPKTFNMNPKNETKIATNREWWLGPRETFLDEEDLFTFTTVDGVKWAYDVRKGVAKKS